MIQDSLQTIQQAAATDSVTDWIQAIGVVGALLLTAYGLLSTRKDSNKMQEQINHLATLAKVQSQRRIQELLPEFQSSIRGSSNSQLGYLITNAGATVKNLKFSVYNEGIQVDVHDSEKLANLEKGESIPVFFRRVGDSTANLTSDTIDGHITFSTFDELPVKLKYSIKRQSIRFYDPKADF